MSDYPFEKLTKEIDDLKNQVQATVSVRVDEFREEVVSIKNRIGAVFWKVPYNSLSIDSILK